mmetsp:Transcript_69254/g.101485  ORF Transcript_69254/g.101485 Transcript_69254/m.101485 type:complete len:278 (+) Transcript_69254:1415-2248(+)
MVARKDDRSTRHVDTKRKRLCTQHDAQVATAEEHLHSHPVLVLQSRVVNSDAAAKDLDHRMIFTHDLACALSDAIEILGATPPLLHKSKLRLEGGLINRRHFNRVTTHVSNLLQHLFLLLLRQHFVTSTLFHLCLLVLLLGRLLQIFGMLFSLHFLCFTQNFIESKRKLFARGTIEVKNDGRQPILAMQCAAEFEQAPSQRVGSPLLGLAVFIVVIGVVVIVGSLEGIAQCCENLDSVRLHAEMQPFHKLVFDSLLEGNGFGLRNKLQLLGEKNGRV